jgi:hypothetical protein
MASLFERLPVGVAVTGADGRLTKANPAFLAAMRAPDMEAAASLALFGPGGGLMARVAEAPPGEEIRFEHGIPATAGRAASLLEATAVPLDDGGWAVVVQDITARKHAEALQREGQQAEAWLQSQVQRLAALRAVDMAIAASVDLRVTLPLVLECATRELGVAAAAILRLDAHTLQLVSLSERGFVSSHALRGRQRMGEGVAGRAALERQTLAVHDLEAGTAVGAPWDDACIRAMLAGGDRFRACYASPLIVRGQVKGVLEVLHHEPLAVDSAWLDLLSALAAQAAVAMDNASLYEELQRYNLDLTAAYESTLEGWARALELCERETEGHVRRVTDLAVKLARRMGISEEELPRIRRGALVHDIGKLAVPDHILFKTEPLTDEEWQVVRRHTEFGRDMLMTASSLRDIVEIPYSHHEWWDGSGYPLGLRAERIPLSARIFSVVDAWDALRSSRRYRKAWSDQHARQLLEEMAGTQFDPRVVQAFFAMLDHA